MIKSSIIDSRNGNTLRVGEEGAINVYLIPKPAPTNQKVLPYVDFLKLEGVGTTSMLVDGSITNQDFFINAKSYDIYINSLVFVIADAGALLNQFGALTALTNGLEFYYFSQTEGKYTIEDGLKTNFDMVRLANFEPSFGSGNDSFKAFNVSGASEAFVGIIDLEDIFGVQWGLKLSKDSTDKLGFIVKDDISAIDAMNIKCYGIRV